MKKISFYINQPGEDGAGILPFSDVVSIIVESGDPGGLAGQFEQFMGDSLKDWYDGPSVDMIDAPMPIEETILTIGQLKKIRNALGGKIIENSFRNFYVTNGNDQEGDDLVKIGFALKHPIFHSDTNMVSIVYVVTEKAIIALKGI